MTLKNTRTRSPGLRLSGVLLVLLMAVGILACQREMPEHDEGPRVAPEVSFNEATGDRWGPLISLRDSSDTWSGQPSGGWHVAAIHAVLLEDGDVLITGWARRDPSNCELGGTRAHGVSFRLDPNELPGVGDNPGSDATYYVTPFDEKGQPASDVLYCAGHNPLPDGRILYSGGSRYENLGQPTETEFGLNYTRIFDPEVNSFLRVEPQMAGGPEGQEGKRWYPTNTNLPDGRSLITGGFYRFGGLEFANVSIEVFDPEATEAADGNVITAAADSDPQGSGRSPWLEVVTQESGLFSMAPAPLDYTHVYVLPESLDADGESWPLLMLGEDGTIHAFRFDEERDGGHFFLPEDGFRGASAAGATGALLPTGEILVGTGSEEPDAAHLINIYDPAQDAWTHIPTGISRYHSTAVLTPAGNVLLMNGGNLRQFYGDPRRPQLLDPETREVTTFAAWDPDPVERGYHSFALLLQDGRLLIGGGIDGDHFTIACERTDLRIYEPAYLHAGPRPALASVQGDDPALPGRDPHLWGRGETVRLQWTGSALAEGEPVVLMATGAVTHAFDQNQRRVPLEVQSSGDGWIEVITPASPQVAPPGTYNLFLVSDEGVPSIGASVRLN